MWPCLLYACVGVFAFVWVCMWAAGFFNYDEAHCKHFAIEVDVAKKPLLMSVVKVHRKKRKFVIQCSAKICISKCNSTH